MARHLTYAEVVALPLWAQYQFYLACNKGESSRVPDKAGPSTVAQAKLCNDWQLALSEWKSTLPTK